MQSTQIAGIDPGLVHTGCVAVEFSPRACEIHVHHEAVLGTDAAAVNAWLDKHGVLPSHTWIEAFRDRGNLNSNAKMHTAVAAIKEKTRGQVLDNTGVKSVVTNDLLRLLGCWSFSTPTHHQDLRSAARIAILGYIKTEHGNAIVADVVRDHLAGRTWSVVHH